MCVTIFIKIFKTQRHRLNPKENGKICLLILVLIRQDDLSFRQLLEMIESKFDHVIEGRFHSMIEDTISDINKIFELVKDMRDNQDYSVSGLFLRKLTIYFDRLSHQGCSRLYEDLITYVSNKNTSAFKRRGHTVLRNVAWQTPRTTRSSNVASEVTTFTNKTVNHEIARIQANEQVAMNPRELHETLRPNNCCKSEITFLRYLNLLRVNESVGSKHLLLAYFDMVSSSVSRSYSPLNYAIFHLHHGEYKRAIECIQECYSCAQEADDDKCLLISLMWLARILIQAKQKNSVKYNVHALLKLVRKRSHKANMAYVQAMSSIALEQLTGPADDSETLKKSVNALKQVVQQSKAPIHTLVQQNPLDKEDDPPSAEVLAVRNSMNDVLAMYYALLSAHLSLMDSNQSSALASQVLLHFDLIEKCGNDDVLLVNENTLIAVRNLAHHVWNTTNDINLAREILIDVCSNKIPAHRTERHSIWRQALSEISFEYYLDMENWCEAGKMIAIIMETDLDGAQLRRAELLQLMGSHDEALQLVNDLIQAIELEESNLTDPLSEPTNSLQHSSSAAIEHRTFIKSKAMLLRATLLDDETKILESLQYATENRFLHVRTACLMQLAHHWAEESSDVMDSLVVDVLANGTRKEKLQLRKLIKICV